MMQIFSDKMDGYSGKVQNFSLMNILANMVDPEAFKGTNLLWIPVDSITKVVWITFGLALLNLVLMYSASFENRLQGEIAGETVLLKIKEANGTKVYEGAIDNAHLKKFRGQKFILWLKLLTPVALVAFCFFLTAFR